MTNFRSGVWGERVYNKFLNTKSIHGWSVYVSGSGTGARMYSKFLNTKSSNGCMF